MVALLQPPPLLAMLLVLLLIVAALWLGLRRGSASGAEPRAALPGETETGFTAEQDEVWGTPDPPPPPRQPFSYDRLAVAAPESDSIQPLARAESPRPGIAEGEGPPAAVAEPSIALPMGEAARPAPPETAAPSETAAPPEATTQPAKDHEVQAEEQAEEISLADIFTRAQQRREQE